MAAVIINHFNRELLPSGYLGVDIFFVISGYVITSSLAGRESKNFLDFLTGFYERRIKRLVPALVVFVLITSVLISLFNPDPGIALGLGWRSLLGISNINLYRASTDYFAQSTELNPFTHTWSLGVEEQFYLLFPFLIWFSGFGQQKANGARNLFVWVGTLTIASLIGFIYLYQVNQPAAYFLMPTRFWEMAAGCLIFIGFQKRARIEQALEQMPPLLVVLAMVGVMFLPVSAAVPATIGIVVLSALLIACLKQGTAAHTLLTLEQVVFIGLRSYSLYLWHWTILSISRWTIGIHWWSVMPQLIGMITLATLSYKYVETPVRARNAGGGRLDALGVGAIAVVSCGVFFGTTDKFLKNNLYTGTKDLPDPSQLRTHPNGVRDKEYCLNNDNIAQVLKECIVSYGNNPERRIWFVGDSLNDSLMPAAAYAARMMKAEMVVYSNFRALFPRSGWVKLHTLNQNDYQFQRNQANFANALKKQLREGDVIVITLRMPLHFGPDGLVWTEKEHSYEDDSGKQINKEASFQNYLKELKRFSTLVRGRGAMVVVTSPMPEFQEALSGNCVMSKQWFNAFNNSLDRCEVDADILIGKDIGRYNAINHALSNIRESQQNLYIWDAFAALCPDKTCHYAHDGKPLYIDSNHPSDYGARKLLAPSLHRFLVDITTQGKSDTPQEND